MGVIKLVSVLGKIGFLSPRSFVRLASAIRHDGINLMLLLSMGSFGKGEQIALVAGDEVISYKHLKLRSEALAYGLSDRFKLGKGKKTAVLCRNHAVLIQSIFAVSRTGSDLYLLNPFMSQPQFDALVKENKFDLVIYDEEFQGILKNLPLQNKKLRSYRATGQSADQMAKNPQKRTLRLERAIGSRIILLTGGTTGKPKNAVHNPSLFNYLNPFDDLMTKLRLDQLNNTFIATPIFHGYGVAILFSLLALGKKIVVHERFKTGIACDLVHRHQIELITVVPSMIAKMLQSDPQKLTSLRCIASGGAKLDPKLVQNAAHSLGNVLYNLYGTSESGLNSIATPSDLSYRSATIGKGIKGGNMAILEDGAVRKIGEIGQLCVRNRWSMKNRKSAWVETGDLGYRDQEGYYFLCGRADDMIVSAGINIYPAEIEQAVIGHPLVEDAAVIGIADELYGEVVMAFVQTPENSGLTREMLVSWLEPFLPKHQIPRIFDLVEKLPYTAIGKLDKKRLRDRGATGGWNDENGKRENARRRAL